MAKRKIVYRLDGEVANGATVIGSLVLRVMMFMAGLVVIAVVTPFAASEVFGVAFGLMLIFSAKDAKVEFSD